MQKSERAFPFFHHGTPEELPLGLLLHKNGGHEDQEQSVRVSQVAR